MKRKILTVALACVLVISICTPALAASFLDVPAGAWYTDSVKYVSDMGLMSGVGNGRFSPDGTVSRAMIVTILYRMEGSPKTAKSSSFRDVKVGSYYESAVSWAAKNGIVTGYSNTKFGPDDSITREQFAAVLCRYAESRGENVRSAQSLTRFKDASDISSYAVAPMKWAVSCGYMTGTSASTLPPRGTATRAQAAAIIARYAENVGSDEKPPEDRKEEIERPDEQVVTGSTIIVGSVSAKPGERVTVPIEIKNNPGVLGMMLTVSFDEDSMKLVSAENGTAVSDVLTLTKPGSLRSGSSFVWYGTNVTGSQIIDGAVLLLTFEVQKNASGSCPVVITSAEGDIIDAELHTVKMTLQNGNEKI